jgi:rhodanese-related sulfurtransferase
MLTKLFLPLFIGIILLLGCGTDSSSQSEFSVQNVDAEQFQELVKSGDGITLDVRTPEEVSEGYIASAITLDYQAEDFEEKINQLPKEKEIYVYCKVGGRSSKAADMLLSKGFSKVYQLEKGLDDWKEKGLPITKQK